MDTLPFRTEYAKSGRAKCKKCKEGISQGELRLAAMVQSAFHDGKQPNWFHFVCFFSKQRPTSEGDIENFGSLRYEDQEKIRKNIQNSTLVVPTAGTSKGKGKKRVAAESSKALSDFGIEYASSGRARCRGCEINIIKDHIRIKKIAYDTEVGMKYGGEPLWHHLECFAKLRDELGFFVGGENLPNFKKLKKEDKEAVKKALPAIKVEEIPAKKVKAEPKDEVDSIKEKDDEKKIIKQQKSLFQIRDALKASLGKKELVLLLTRNKQEPPTSLENILDLAADILTFGALKKCPNCKGQYVFDTNGYRCKGDLTEWVKCNTLVPTPERSACYIPSEVKEKCSFLAKYKSVVTNRLVKYVPPSISTFKMRTLKKEETETAEPKVKRDKPPLYKLEFVILGKTEKPKDELKLIITELGGRVTTKIHDKLAAVISTKEEVEKMSSRMKQVQEFGIQVVPEDYLDDAKAGGAIAFISSRSICDWGTDPILRIPQEETYKSSSRSIYTKSVPKSVTMKLKGGLAVDPDSELEDKAHVFKENKNVYNAVLGLTDIQSGKNSYYKLQILEADKGNRYWLFRSWGRIGTTIGGTKLEDMSTKNEAIKKFEIMYKDKTNNEFEDRENFKKYPGRMYPIEVDYGQDEKLKELEMNSNIKSKLHPSIQNIVKMLFDVDAMKKVMLEFELDMEKMPLGRLSKNQLQKALKVINELSELVEKGGSNAQFIDASNRFYTLIPHDFGVDLPTVLDTLEVIKGKIEMLESLMEIEVAYNMLNTELDSEKHPLDSHYEQLKTDMSVVDHDSEEFKLLVQYVQNTHAETHNTYDLEVLDIYKVKRKNEDRRYKPFKKLHNRKLLWHGSRLTNYVGILSNGLKIAPPEAPVTGYMFGKGIYFADMVSKSANYCFTNKNNSTGLLLLCEVALGDMLEFTKAEYVTKLPKNKHSTKGIGKTQPNPAENHVREDGVEIPLGRGITDDKLKTSLLYNEYIVYDVAQVNVQYMFKMNFKYKY